MQSHCQHTPLIEACWHPACEQMPSDSIDTGCNTVGFFWYALLNEHIFFIIYLNRIWVGWKNNIDVKEPYELTRTAQLWHNI